MRHLYHRLAGLTVARLMTDASAQSPVIISPPHALSVNSG